MHLGCQLLPGDPPGAALDEAAGQLHAAVLLPGAGTAGGDDAQKLLGLKIQARQVGLLGILHGGQQALGGGKDFVQRVLLAAHHRAVGHQSHGEEVVVAFRADADEEFQPFPVRLYDGGVPHAREPLDEGAPGKPHMGMATVGIFPFPVQNNQAAVVLECDVPVAPPVVRFVDKAAGKVSGSPVGAHGPVRYSCLVLWHDVLLSHVLESHF